MANFYLGRLPENDDELWHVVHKMWDVVIPRHTCGNPDHTPPFQAFADAYFNRGGSITLWHGSRGLSGKSFMLSILGITKAFLLGADVNMLGGSLAQSSNLHEHMRNALNSEFSPRYMIETESNTLLKLTNKARIRPLTASQKTVRGPHPPFLILDEIDEMDLDILDAALGQPMPQKNYMGDIIKPYTVMCLAEGTEVTVYGGNKPVEQVEAGDLVLTRDGWFPVYERIDNGYRETISVHLSNGRTLVCTQDHRIAVGDGWVEAGDLAVGDVLTTVDPAQFGTPVVPSLAAGAALPASVDGNEGVIDRVLVPSGAMGLGGVDSAGSGAAQDVDSGGHRLQMLGIEAPRHSAQVIQRPVIGNLPDQHLVGEAVDGASVDGAVDHSVPARGGSVPQPAPGLVHGAAGQEPVTVIGVTAGLTRHVYDLSVMGTPEFVADSIIVHNCSTWQNPEGTFTEVRRRFEERGLPIVQWCYQCSANPIDGWLTQETIDAKKMEIPAEMWRTEYELGEPAIGNRAFDTEAVDRMFANAPEPIYEKVAKDYEEYTFKEPERDGYYVVGADWGKEQDYTVISVWRADRNPYEMVYYMRVNRRPYPQMIGWFNDAIKRYSADAIHDSTGLGNVVSDYVDIRARGFTMTGEKRDAMLSEYVNAVEKGMVSAPRVKTAYLAHKYCVAEGSLVWTMRGAVPIEEVKVGDQALTRKGFRNVSATFDNGERLVWRLRTSDGKEVLLTGDHSVATLRGWVEAQDLQLGDVCFVRDADPAPATALGIDDEIDARVLMAVGAVNDGGTLGSDPISAQDVRSLVNWFKVHGVAAMPHPTQMVQAQIGGADEGVVGQTMSQPRTPAWSPEAVAVLPDGSLPQPASFGVYLDALHEVVEIDGVLLAHVVECIPTYEQVKVYDITVDGEHEFFANGIVVHNCQVGDLYSRSQEYHLPDEVCSFALAYKMMGKGGKPAGPITVKRDKEPTELERMFSPEAAANVYVKSGPPKADEINLLV